MTLLVFYASFLCSKMSGLAFKMENFSCARGCISVACYLNTTTCSSTFIETIPFFSFICVPVIFPLYSYEFREVVSNNYVKTCVEKVSLKYDFRVAPYHGHAHMRN